MKEKLKNIAKLLRIESCCKKIYNKCKYIYIKIYYTNDRKKEVFIKKEFKKRLGYDIDFEKDPVTYNQKIQFRKLYDNNLLYSVCSDKYAVREYVKEKIGEKYLIPLLLVTDRLTKEQWDKLPNQFVAKANHNSGPVQIVKNKEKVNKNKIIRELNNQLKIDYGIFSMEKYYSRIPRKIIVEKFLKDKNRAMLQDIKIHCFRGKNEKYFIDLCSRESTDGEVFSVLYDENWNNLKVTAGNLDLNDYPKPKNLEEILGIAKKLSEDFKYVRVDLYNLEEEIYFGELTFCENSGYGKFTNEEWDYRFGELWEYKN